MRLYSKLHEFEICTFILEICFGGIEKSRLDSGLVTFCMMKVTVLGESWGDGKPCSTQTRPSIYLCMQNFFPICIFRIHAIIFVLQMVMREAKSLAQGHISKSCRGYAQTRL